MERDKIYQITNAKTYVFADSVLCLGGKEEKPNEAWKEKIKWYFESNHFERFESHRWRTNGVRVANIPRFTAFGFLEQVQKFSERSTIHPMFLASSSLGRGDLRSKGGSKKTIHFNGREQNVERILRTMISANQFSVYGAVADICTEVSKDTMVSVKPEAHAAHDPLETMGMVPQ